MDGKVSGTSGDAAAAKTFRPLVPWRVAASGGWRVAVAAWPVVGAAFAVSGIGGVTPAMVLLELTVTGGLLLGIFQLRRRGIPFRFRDQRGPTMNVLAGATLTCGTPALVWATSEVIHNPVLPIVGGAVTLPINLYGWVAELRAWRRGERATPFMEQEEIRAWGAVVLALGGLGFGVAGILNAVGVLHWGWLPK